MRRILMELTDRCNLRCRHCFQQRHAGNGDLPLGIIEGVLRDAAACSVNHVSFTGGEPTLHREFVRILDLCVEANCSFSFVSNGSTFRRVYRSLLARRQWFSGVTFSVDGAREATHDQLRGEGSYRQVLRAASICNFTGLPFTLNMVLTRENRMEMDALVDLAVSLGSGGVRFGFLMPGDGVDTAALALTLSERRVVESEVRRLQQMAEIPVVMAPGYYSESPFFPCGPLELEELNIDWRGRLTLCCQVSGYWSEAQRPDVIANLHDMSLVDADAMFRRRVATYLADKRNRLDRGEFRDADHFPCAYCVDYLGTTHQLSFYRSPDIPGRM
jgi:MoaA/NifB/PqqE/SkfB family radical SAM enzyme